MTQNNPGVDKRSDRANPGGHGNGLPEHAGPKDMADNEDDDSGPKGEAKGHQKHKQKGPKHLDSDVGINTEESDEGGRDRE